LINGILRTEKKAKKLFKKRIDKGKPGENRGRKAMGLLISRSRDYDRQAAETCLS